MNVRRERPEAFRIPIFRSILPNGNFLRAPSWNAEMSRDGLVFPKVPVEALAPASDRWTPLFLEHGRLEVDDSSVKFISAEGGVIHLPVATISALLLGPGTTVTHAAIAACANSNTPVCWVGSGALRFYAHGISPTHANDNARLHADLHAHPQSRAAIARRMFLLRFPDLEVSSRTIQQLRGLEGERIRKLYQEFGEQYGVTWKGRNYDAGNWNIADEINRTVSAANAAFYGMCAAIVCSLGFLPQLGFIHAAGSLPFVYDIADIYKPVSTLPAAFAAVRQDPGRAEENVLLLLKEKIEAGRLMEKIPKQIIEFMKP